MIMLPLLEHEASMLMDIHQDSSLLVLAEGLGMDALVYSTVKLHSDPHNLLLVSNYRLSEARFLCELLSSDDILHSPGIITADVSGKDREAIYKRGGVVFVTSRILVVDLLMDRMPACLVTGVLILRAHELQEACQENFAIRLLRDRNPSIFVKALSDNAIALTSGFNHAEQLMMQTGITKLVLWPRFNIQVVSCLSEVHPNVEEIRVPLTPNMTVCQSCILDLTKACIKELVDQNPALNADELNLESALLPNFDRLLGLYLDPVWNQLSSNSRRLVSDIASLRRLLRVFIEGDAVSFLDSLEEHRQAALCSLGVSGVQSAQSRRGSRTCPAWFLMDQSDRLLEAARARVYSDFAKKQVHIEMNPKWQLIADILRDIHRSVQSESDTTPPTILILVGHEQGARMLERYLRRGTPSIRRYLRNTRLHDLSPAQPTTSKIPRTTCHSSTLTLTQLCRPAGEPPTDDKSDSDSSSTSSEHKSPVKCGNDDQTLPLGCRRVQVSPRLLSNSSSSSSSVSLDVIIRVAPNFTSQDIAVNAECDPQRADYLKSFGHRLAYVLNYLQPRHVILYEPRVSWVRELEIHKARLHASDASKTPQSLSLDVYFMLYEKSVEEQRYLTHLRREKEAFESLIQLSSRIVIPRDAVLPPSALGQSGSAESNQQPRVIVDMREFRSELPALLYRKGLKVDPMTLSIADYILAPHLCVERKSVSDLVGSLNSGRLYQQCTSMSRHYPYPILLIEFSLPTKITGSALVRGGIGARGDGAIGFSLYTGRHAIASGGEFNARHLLSKLVLLTIHFPNLRLLWSVTPYCTAELFVELKQGRTEPSVETLPQDGEHLEDHNVEAVDMLLKLPGISWKNYRRVISKVPSLVALARCSLEQLTEILDSRECATQLHHFLHADLELLRTTDRKEENTKVKAESEGPSVVERKLARGPRLALAGRVKTRRGRGKSTNG